MAPWTSVQLPTTGKIIYIISLDKLGSRTAVANSFLELTMLVTNN